MGRANINIPLPVFIRRICIYLYLFMAEFLRPRHCCTVAKCSLSNSPSIRCDIGRRGLVYGPGQESGAVECSGNSTAAGRDAKVIIQI